MRETKQKIRSMMIFEILGKPKEYLVNSLNSIIDQLDKEEGVSVKSKKIKEPKKMDENAGIANAAGNEFKVEQSEFYVTFADVELETDSIFVLANVMFRYMPAHVEVISPENIHLSNGEWSDILSGLIQNLHAYDEVARVMQVEKASLESQLRSFIEKDKKKKPEKNAQKKSKTPKKAGKK